MSTSEMSIFGGQPSITTPMPPPCDSPNVVTRKSWPKVVPIPRASQGEMRRNCRAFLRNASDRGEGGLQIVDQIAHVFDANGKTHQRISDAERFPLLLRNRCVRHKRGMIDQAFDAAQTFRERKEMRVLKKPSRACEIGLQDDRHHSAESAHLNSREIMLRMRLESRITDRLDLRPFYQPARDLQRVRAVPLHPQRKRFQTAHD